MIPTLIGIVVLALVVFGAVTYNALVKARNKTQEAWSGIDVQLQRRADLVPNLVETVKGYAAHEEGLLVRVTEARAQMVNATGPRDAGVADDQLEGALKSLFAVSEDYPDLKADGNFLELQRELTDLEEEISFARRYYNGSVEQQNNRVQTFPTMLVAGPLGFSAAEFFKADGEARFAPRVDRELGT